jgi:hypothetical protein
MDFKALSLAFLILLTWMVDCPTKAMDINPDSRKFLVEHFDSSSLLRKPRDFQEAYRITHQTIDIIYYMRDGIAHNNNPAPNIYGYKRYLYLRQLKPWKNDKDYRAISLLDQEYQRFHHPSDFSSNALELVMEATHSRKASNPLLQSSFMTVSQDGLDPQRYRGEFVLYWNRDIPMPELEQYHYNLFLIAEEIHGYPMIIEDLAYDFIPLKGDQVSLYSGKGFPLINTSRKPDLSQQMLHLTTELFQLPVKGEMPREDLYVKHWSLQLFIEDQNNQLLFSKRVTVGK